MSLLPTLISHSTPSIHTYLSTEKEKKKKKLTRKPTSYSATIQINPSHPALLYTHATAGTAVPVNSGFWTVSDAALSFRFQRVPTTGTGNYRLILTDAHVPGPGTSVTLTYLSPTGDWAGAGTTVYTGVTSFTLL